MKKNTIISLFVFAGLLAAVMLSQRGKQEKGITRVSYAQLDTKAVDRVSITGHNPVELEKKDGIWKVGDGRLADENAVKRLTESISQIASSDLVTRKSSRYEELKVDETNGTQVEVFSMGKSLAKFTVGESERAGAHVRIDDAVYLVKNVYPYVFSKKASTWYKLKLFDIKMDDVVRLEVKHAEGHSFSLQKKDDQWVFTGAIELPDGFRFDAEAARSLVSSLIHVRAQEIVFERPEASREKLDDGFDAWVFQDKTGERRELRLGGADESGAVYMRASGYDDTFLLNQHTAINLRKKALDLRDMKLIKLDISKVRRLEVMDGKRRLSFEKKGDEWKISESSEKIPADFKLDPQAVRRQLQRLVDFKALSVSRVSSGSKTGLGRATTKVTAILDDDTTVSLVFGAMTKVGAQEQVYTRGNMDKLVYLASKYGRDSLVNGLESYKQRPMPNRGMPNLDPETLAKLPPDVRSKLLKQYQQEMRKQKMIQAIQSKIKKKGVKPTEK
jgi:hypothetical protein